ncbi:penicillin-insensitive murein endopeptidase [Jannaschia pagri]|uniref:Penicillin-insensitive murein endopeptidase n=1 Tax=Jannaschia pagri TaxID=2829797 RepID=A0ABQ4NQ75_9RHOB|nr:MULTISPECIES: penicillin-insensitive murein endopeptidase [unclassified Jannaschia]GIT92589.1 penicillin-insensitive murein endopeptidase [Jannaschia sp. AI_61]GIT96551.1 penicillin-insensitive murein endopeptidase [Jannaschia sp. AI_62]
MVRTVLACLIAAALWSAPAQAQTAKELFGRVDRPSAAQPEPYGRHARGCAAGLVELAETGPSWQAMRLSRNRNWGHPEMVDLVQDLARHMDRIGWGGIYVGDLSAPRGGPISGHASHQIGLDADIWLYPATDMTLSRRQRENLSAISMRRQNGAFVNDNWTRGQHELIKKAAQDPRTTRIFIFPGAKVEMCKTETGDRSWLRKVRPWYGHHYHFHIRIACPRGARNCEDQAAPPPGDGCAEAQDWVNNILNPPPPDPNAPPPRPRVEPTLADMPAQCAAVLSAPSR